MRILPILCLALPLAAQSNLAVKAATSKRVDLTWTGTASSYTVQRAILGASFSTIATATSASYSDTTIDPYTTYRYQIVAAATSNEVTVGPPPSGINNVAQAPVVGSQIVTSYGLNLNMTLDSNGDPAFVFIFDDPKQNGDHSINPLLFRSWNRAQYSWNAIVTIGTVGDVTNSQQRTALAYDSSTGTFIAASEVADPTQQNGDWLTVWQSTDGGVTWTSKATLNSNAQESVEGLSLAAANGNLYLAYTIDTEGVFYTTGKLSSPSTSWSTKTDPFGANTSTLPGDSPSIALDNSGNPAIVFTISQPASQEYLPAIYFWRPATSGAPVKITDANGDEDGQDTVAVKLMFYNGNPRVLFWMPRGDGPVGNESVGVHFVRSDDGGNTWKAPVAVPPDGSASTDFPFDMAIDAQGDILIAFGQNGTEGDDSHHCPGGPRLAQSTDLVNFTTCPASSAAEIALANSTSSLYQQYPGAVQAAYGGNGKMYVLWMNNGNGQADSGVLMYREPPPNTATAPIINTDGTGVMNGAINLPGSGIVAGSWVTIKGLNFSDHATDWSNLDFTNGLPKTINGVQVLFNGQAAATYYIQSNQINVQAPSNVPTSGTVSVQVVANGNPSNTVTGTAAATAPGIFPYSLDGVTFYPAAVFLDSTLVGDPAVLGSTRKAKAGDVVLLFATGMGVAPAGVLVNPTGFQPAVQVLIDSTPATVSSTFLVAPGEWQINIVIPSGLADGNHQLIVKTGGVSSQSGIVIPITH